MKKNKILYLFLILSIIFTSPLKAYATEIETTQEETTDDVTVDNSETVNETTQTVETQENTQKPEVPNNETKSENSENSTTSYGWLKITSELLTNDINSKLILEFEFTNKETNEIITKNLSSESNFENVVKLPTGTYNVKLLTEEYEENVIYEKQVIVNSKEVEYKISINNITVEKELETPKEEESNTMLDLLKNNFLFLVLLLGSGGFLLYREIKKNN